MSKNVHKILTLFTKLQPKTQNGILNKNLLRVIFHSLVVALIPVRNLHFSLTHSKGIHCDAMLTEAIAQREA